MSLLQTFDFDGDPVRSFVLDGEPWFVGRDLCRVLGIENNRDAVSRLSKDDRREINLNTVGITDAPSRGNPNVVAVNEPGLYQLIFESRKAEAERFKRWVFHEVLPAIRRTGTYGRAALQLADLAALARICDTVKRTHGVVAARQVWADHGGPDLPVDGRPEPAAHSRRGRPSSPREHAAVLIVRRFLFECCEVQTGGRVQARPLYRAYAAWAERRREQVMTETAFGRAMILAGCDRQSCTGARFYLDIQLRDGEMITTGAIGEA